MSETTTPAAIRVHPTAAGRFPNAMVTVDELAAACAVGTKPIYALCKSGGIKALWFGRIIRIPRHEAIRFLREGSRLEGSRLATPAEGR